MIRKVQHRRLWLAAFLLGTAFTALAYRLVDLQVLRHDELRAKALRYTQGAISLEPRRGDLRDARGNLLATSVMVKSVFADPSLLHGRHEEVARILARLLEMSEADLTQRLQPRQEPDGSGRVLRYVRLKPKVTVESWRQVQQSLEQAFPLPKGKPLTRAERELYVLNADLRRAVGVDSIDSQLRIYPHRQLAAHILGFVGADDH